MSKAPTIAVEEQPAFTILSASVANEDGTAVSLKTAERGAVMISAKDRPDLWAKYLEWGGQPVPYVAPDLDADDLASLNAALAQEGSLGRATLELLYGVITGKIPVTPSLTKPAYIAMIAARMRTKG